MDKITELVQEYFKTPIAESGQYYPEALCLYEKNGERVARPVSEEQPLGANATVQLTDRLSDEIQYAHVAYEKDGATMQEILAYMHIRAGWKLIAVLRAWCDSPFENLFEDPLAEAKEFQSIGEVLGTYLDGVYLLDAEKALEMFADGARMRHPLDEETFADVPCTVFRERWANQENSKQQGIPRFTGIYHIELLNASTAVAKVGVAKLNDHFYDYLYCLKLNGQWKIVHKITQMLWRREA